MNVKTTVINLSNNHRGEEYVRICRPSRWGNPFKIGRDGTREEVIRKYEAYILTRPDLLAQLPTLKGKRLACWCAPFACHGDILARMADELEESAR